MLFSHLVGLELGEADGEVDGFPLIDGVPLGCDDMEGWELTEGEALGSDDTEGRRLTDGIGEGCDDIEGRNVDGTSLGVPEGWVEIDGFELIEGDELGKEEMDGLELTDGLKLGNEEIDGRLLTDGDPDGAWLTVGL